ncbi:MAG: methyltransferase domain-containing protein [Actinobacteria bacterium]|nr:methyltransferase domain-containing protein [Actinomycetota bacterium]
MRTIRRIWTRLFRGIYSAIADNIYEPLVVKTAFPLFGKDLPGRVLEQGRRAVASAAGGPIIDLPVGTGYFAVDLATAHPGIVVGADVAWGMVERTRRTATEAGASRLIPLQADGFHLPFADGTFAAVVSSNGLQVMPDLAGAVAELHRVTRPGGSIYVSIPTIPIGALLPRAISSRLPTFFRSGRDVRDALFAVGFTSSILTRTRFAYLIMATREN